jgi:hypothetical protein
MISTSGIKLTNICCIYKKFMRLEISQFNQPEKASRAALASARPFAGIFMPAKFLRHKAALTAGDACCFRSADCDQADAEACRLRHDLQGALPAGAPSPGSGKARRPVSPTFPDRRRKRLPAKLLNPAKESRALRPSGPSASSASSAACAPDSGYFQAVKPDFLNPCFRRRQTIRKPAPRILDMAL